MNRKKILISLALIFFTIFIPWFDLSALSAIDNLKNMGAEAGYNPGDAGAPPKEFGSALMTYVDGFLLIIGAFYVVLLIFAGYLWMSSAGNNEQISRAKKIILWSSAGIAIIIFGRIIAEFVIISLGEASNAPYSPTS
ncbi:hypothetical protein C4569_04055 [Candidatus Parcubacteria bacterium]|nr:MAG: hypothetical protein C4569_04055 [Candidatus Parcubacteria bacterium]